MTDHTGTVATPGSNGRESGAALDQEEHDKGLADLVAETVELAKRLPGPLRRVALRSGGHEVEIEWQPPAAESPAAAGAPATATEWQPPAAAPAIAAADAVVVRAPLVGTFYRAAGPGAARFVEVGDTVEVGQTLAIIEAMKLMNTIVAETPATVVEICVSDGEPVEFDQPLLLMARRDLAGNG